MNTELGPDAGAPVLRSLVDSMNNNQLLITQTDYSGPNKNSHCVWEQLNNTLLLFVGYIVNAFI